MKFEIKNKLANGNWLKWQVIKDAKSVILLYKIKSKEQKLNKYLLETYNLNLIGASLYLLQHSKIYKNLDNNLIILFPDKKDDELASLITYGNLELSGSDILKKAFFRKD